MDVFLENSTAIAGLRLICTISLFVMHSLLPIQSSAAEKNQIPNDLYEIIDHSTSVVDEEAELKLLEKQWHLQKRHLTVTPDAFVARQFKWTGSDSGAFKDKRSRTLRIWVCWEPESPNDTKAKTLVRKAVEKTWANEKWSLIRFDGWRSCEPDTFGLRLLVEDPPPITIREADGTETQHRISPRTLGIGNQLDGVYGGIRLNFTFKNWNKKCLLSKRQRDICIHSIAVHEFGHALGYAHEHNRKQTPPKCRARHKSQGFIPGAEGEVTAYDPNSVMNYCRNLYFRKIKLSDKDQESLGVVYK